MRYTHVLFDADDTLFDFQASCRVALSRTVEQLVGRELPGAFEVYERNNRLWWLAFEKGETTMDKLSTGRFVDFIRDMELTGCGTPEQWRDEYQKNLGACCILIDGAEELCNKLLGRCRMYIVTNGIASVQRDRMSRAPIRGCFEELFISQELGCRKPQPEYFEIVMQKLGDVEKSRILVVGDSLTSDIKGGIDAGLDVCWYNPHGKEPGELKPNYTVSTLAEIEEIIAGGN